MYKIDIFTRENIKIAVKTVAENTPQMREKYSCKYHKGDDFLMHKTNFKKVLSVFLSFLMILSCWVWVAPDTHTHANAAPPSGGEKAIIAVPETVYMTPSAGESKVGQYYVNNTITSSSYGYTLEKAAANGNAYLGLHIDGAAKFSVELTTLTSGIGDVVIANAGATSGSYEYSANAANVFDLTNGFVQFAEGLGLYINGTGLTAGKTADVEWKFTVTMNDGEVKTYYAYSTLYAPWYQPVGAASKAVGAWHNTYASSILWVQGVHGYSDGDRANSYYVQTANFLPMLGALKAPSNNNPETNWVQSGSNGLSPTMAYNVITESGTKYHARANTISPTANLTVDTSRYNNFSQIPNFRVGFMVTDKDGIKNGTNAWYVSDYGTSKGSSYYNGTDRSGSQYTSDWNDSGTAIWSNSSDTNCGIKVNQQSWNKAISGTASFRLKSAARSEYSATITSTGWNNNFVNISVTGINKATLRTLVLEGSTLAKEDYTTASWSTYYAELKKAAPYLGNPTEGSYDTTALQTARDKLVRLYTVKFVDASTEGGPVVSTAKYANGTAAADVVVPAIRENVVDANTHYVNYTWSGPTAAISGDSTFYGDFASKGAHTVVTTPTVGATCVNTGLTEGKHCSVCNYVISAQTTTPATGTHSYTVFVETVAPSCTAGGYDTYKCATCDAKQKMNVTSATPHTAATREENRVEATCAVPGSYVLVTYCSICTAELNRENKTIPATNAHDYSIFVEKIDPTCTSEGYDVYKCATCDGTQNKYVVPAAHTLTDVAAKEPTCTEAGWDAYKQCSKCDYNTKVEKNPTGVHNYNVFVKTVASTCTTDGYDVYKCATCTLTTNTNTVPAHHTLTTVSAKPATCGEDGWEAYEECSKCDFNTKVTIPATGAHVYEYAQNADGKTHTGTCTGCTATTSGICAGENATCTSDAICNTCNSVYQEKLGHSFTDYKSNGDATCTADGTKTAKCDRCDAKETVTDKGSAKGHTWQDADCTTPKTCSVCGATEGEALGHSFTDYKSNGDATCTVDGTKTAKCDRCDATDTIADKGSATGHSPAAAVEENVVKASCLAAGSYDSVVYCSISTCKAEISRTKQTIAQREHVYGEEWTVVTAPTHTTEGLEKKTCTNEADDHYEACTHEITQVIPVVTDETAPEATLTIDESTWNKFLTAISFGTYVSKELQLEIEASDAETGIKSIEYYISATALTEEEVKAVTDWTEYNGKVAISREDAEKMVVYVKAVNGQNVAAYVSSDGYTFDLSLPVIEVEKDCTTATITVTDANIDTVKVDDTEVTLTDGAYTIEGAGTYVVVAADKAGNTTTETITINGHQEKTLDAVEETCTTTGLTEGKICSVCDTVLIKQNTIDATGHSFVNKVEAKDATCTADGNEAYKQCANCNKFFAAAEGAYSEKAKDSADAFVIPAPGHKFADEFTVDTKATCDAEGSKSKHCANCDAKAEVTVIPARTHKIVDTTVAQAATCTVDGVMNQKCENEATDEYEACAYTTTREIPATGHKETTLDAVESTCTETGLTEGKKCTVCGTVTVKQEVTEKLGHNHVATVTDPTCNDRGYTTHVCSRCNDTYVDTYVDARGHNYSTENATNNNDGTHTLACTRCAEGTTGHFEIVTCSYNDVVTAPTCTAQGYTTHICTVCSYSYSDTYINATGHTWGSWTAAGNGTHTRECTVCQNEAGRTETAACTYGDWTQTVAPKCEEDGEKAHTCTVCNDTVTEVVPQTGHAWNEGVIGPESTCKVAGTITYTCQHDASHTYTEDAPLAPHDWMGADCNNPSTCRVCGDESGSAIGHTFTEFVKTVDYTCTADGYTVYKCVRCAETENRDFVDAAHRFAETFTVDDKATCDEDGLKSRHCTKCDAVTDETVIKARGHKLVDTTVAQDATCKETGIMNQACSNTATDEYEACAYTTTRVIDVDPEAHNWEADYTVDTKATCDANGTKTIHCEYCDTKKPGSAVVINKREHNYKDNGVATPATCTIDGVMNTICTNDETAEYAQCRHESTSVIPATGHRFGEITTATEATCTTAGNSAYKQCANCSKYFAADADNKSTAAKDSAAAFTISALDHDFAETFTVDAKASCTETGSKSRHCSRCSEKTEVTVIPVREHKYEDVEIITPATCNAEGVMRTICTNEETDTHKACSHESTRVIVIKPDAHSFTNYISDNNATCFSNCTETATCDNGCGATDTKEIANSTVDHKYETYTRNGDATCQKNETETASCSFGCGQTHTREIADSKVGHNFETYTGNGDATCQKNETETASCAFGCGEKNTREIADSTVGHKYETYTRNGDATCQKNETETASCSFGCGEKNTREIADSKVAHNYVNYVANNDATCQKNRTETGTCSYGCGKTDTREIADSKVEHKFTSYTANGEATCQHNDTETAFCDYGCGQTHTREIANSTVDHKYETYTRNGDATCQKNETETASCSFGCGQTHTREIADSKVGHNFETYTGNGDATCQKNETETASCAFGCGEKNTREIADSKVAHNYVNYVANNDATCQKNQTETASCSFGCGTTDTREITNSKVEHKFTSYTVNGEATCQDNDTETAFCDYGCGATDTREIANSTVDHKFTSYTANDDATCSKNETETASCAYGCGETHTREIANSTVAHNYVDYTENNDATCQKNETETASCSFGCGATNTREIANSKVGHKFETYTGNGDATCQRNETETAACAYGCGATNTREIADSKADHTRVEIPAVAATCQATGLTAGVKCSVCSTILVEQTVTAKTAHAEVIDAAVAPGCETTGLTEGKHCSYCGTVTVAQVTVGATGHDFDMTKAILTRPTQKANGTWTDGYYSYTCKNDPAHTKQETVKRADYAAYDAIIESVNTLLKEDLPEEDIIKLQKLLNNTIAQNLIADEQANVDAEVEKINDVITAVYPDAGLTLVIRGADTFYAGTVIDLSVFKVNENISIEATNVKWTCSKENTVFFANGRLLAVSTGTVTLTATSGLLTATKTINIVEGGNVRIIRFNAMNQMHYIIEDSFAVYDSGNLYWSNDHDIRFRVYTNSTFTFETHMVYLNGVAVEPDAQGYYTIPAGVGDVRVNVAGAVYDEDDEGNRTKFNFWEWLVALFKKIVNFFKSIFGIA